MSSEIDERVVDEIEALKAILMDEVVVRTNESGSPVSVEIVVVPSTAHDALQQYVCLTLVVDLPLGYPDVIPTLQLRNPRGLDDVVISRVEQDAKEKCDSFRGQPVIYELIELVREQLTASNLPSCQCAICLYGFREGDQFTKTHCYHYFHSHCLACHVTSTEKSYKEEQEKLPAWQRNQRTCQVLCPVCREPVSCDMELLSNAPQPLDVQSAHQFELSDELRALQDQMAALFIRQKQRGGIIDPEAEESKLLLVTNRQDTEEDVPPLLPSSGPSLPVSPSEHSTSSGSGGLGPRSWRHRAPAWGHPGGRGGGKGSRGGRRQGGGSRHTQTTTTTR